MHVKVSYNQEHDCAVIRITDEPKFASWPLNFEHNVLDGLASGITLDTDANGKLCRIVLSPATTILTYDALQRLIQSADINGLLQSNVNI